ncbi:MAG: hypothetical protein AB7W16_01550 [Candidatus Obscuribacterales bacterium]
MEQVVLIDGAETRVTSEKSHQISYNTGSALISLGETGDLEVRGNGLSLDDVRLNGRVLPRWLGTVRLFAGDQLLLGDRKQVKVEIPGTNGHSQESEPDEESAEEKLVVRLGRSRAAIKPHRLNFTGVDNNDTRAMFRWDGRSLVVSPAREKDLAFVWNQKANYLFPYQWYRVTQSDEVRVGGVNGQIVDFPRSELEKEPVPDAQEPSEMPLMTIDSERIRLLLASEIELEQSAEPPPGYDLAKCTEYLVCPTINTTLSSGWRLRKLAQVNNRTFFFARRLRDDYPAVVEILMPDHRYDPRELHERADAALSSINHPHMVRVLSYGTIANPGNKHGPYHVRVIDRFNGVGILSILKHCGKLDARSALCVMLPVLDALEKLEKAGSSFTPSPALIESRRKSDPFLASVPSGADFVTRCFSLDQLWLTSTADGRVMVKVDCFTGGDYQKILARLTAQQNGGPNPGVARIGHVLYTLVTGKRIRSAERPEPCASLSGFESILEKIALDCICGEGGAGTVREARDLLENVWGQMYSS